MNDLQVYYPLYVNNKNKTLIYLLQRILTKWLN